MPLSRNFLTRKAGFLPDSWAISWGKRLPDFDVRNYGYSKLTPFIKSWAVMKPAGFPPAVAEGNRFISV